MGRILDDARRAAGLPPESDLEKQERLASAGKIKGCGQQMMAVGCGLTVVVLLAVILLLLV